MHSPLPPVIVIFDHAKVLDFFLMLVDEGQHSCVLLIFRQLFDLLGLVDDLHKSNSKVLR